MRAVPFSNLNERLYRIVRQTARELDKKAELTIEGAEVELDRSVLEQIGAPLEHMLRNALAHGIEAPAARAAAGKPESGRIIDRAAPGSNEMVLILTDDGAGLELRAPAAQGPRDGPDAPRARSRPRPSSRSSSSSRACRPPRRSPSSPAAASAWTW